MTFENYKSRVIVERINGSRFDKFLSLDLFRWSRRDISILRNIFLSFFFRSRDSRRLEIVKHPIEEFSWSTIPFLLSETQVAEEWGWKVLWLKSNR